MLSSRSQPRGSELLRILSTPPLAFPAAFLSPGSRSCTPPTLPEPPKGWAAGSPEAQHSSSECPSTSPTASPLCWPPAPALLPGWCHAGALPMPSSTSSSSACLTSTPPQDFPSQTHSVIHRK